MSDFVVDASAILAILQDEAFTHFDGRRIPGAWISTINLSEILAKLYAKGFGEEDAMRALGVFSLRAADFTERHAGAAARLVTSTRRAGLSFGDRACLATAQLLGLPAVTADRAWATVDAGVAVILVR